MEFIYAAVFLIVVCAPVSVPFIFPISGWKAHGIVLAVNQLGFALIGFFLPEAFSLFGIRMDRGSIVPWLLTGIACVVLMIVTLAAAITALRKRLKRSKLQRDT